MRASGVNAAIARYREVGTKKNARNRKIEPKFQIHILWAFWEISRQRASGSGQIESGRVP